MAPLPPPLQAPSTHSSPAAASRCRSGKAPAGGWRRRVLLRAARAPTRTCPYVDLTSPRQVCAVAGLTCAVAGSACLPSRGTPHRGPLDVLASVLGAVAGGATCPRSSHGPSPVCTSWWRLRSWSAQIRYTGMDPMVRCSSGALRRESTIRRKSAFRCYGLLGQPDWAGLSLVR